MLWFASAVALILLMTSKYGVGVSPDSVNYLSMAQNFADTGEMRNYQGEYLTVFPPLYTVLLAVGAFFFDVQRVAVFIQAILFGLLAYSISSIQHYDTKRATFIGIIVVILTLFSPVLAVSSMAWTELLYILLSLFMFILLWRYIDNPYSVRILLLLALVVSLAPITRYIGIVNIATAVIAVFFYSKHDLRTRLIMVMLFGIAVTLPLLVWMLRNYGIDGTFLGPRNPSAFSLSQNIYRTYNTVAGWFFPGIIVRFLPGFLVAFSGVMLISVVFFYLRNQLTWKKLLPLLVFIVLYVLWLNYSATQYAFDAIGSRLLSPIYVPILLILAFVFQALNRHDTNRLINTMFVVILAFFAIRSSLIYGLQLRNAIDNGAGGYNSVAYHESITYLLSLESLDDELPIYSSRPDALWFVSGGKIEAAYMPRRGAHNSPIVLNSIDDIMPWPQSTPAYLFIFPGRSYWFTVEELSTVLTVRRLESAGIIEVFVVE